MIPFGRLSKARNIVSSAILLLFSNDATAQTNIPGEEYVLCDCGTLAEIDEITSDLVSGQGTIGTFTATVVGDNLEVNITSTQDMCVITETHICNVPTQFFNAEEDKKVMSYDIDIQETYDFVCTDTDPDGPSSIWGHATVSCECGQGWALQAVVECDPSQGVGCDTCLEQTDEGMVVSDTEDPDKTVMWTVGPYAVGDLMKNVMSYQFLMESFGCQLEDMEAVAAIDITIQDGGLGEGLSMEVNVTVTEGWTLRWSRDYFGAALTVGEVTNEPQYLDFELFPSFTPFGLNVLDLRGEFTMYSPVNITDMEDPIWISLGGTACPGFAPLSIIDEPEVKSAYYDFCVCCTDVDTTTAAPPTTIA